MSRNTDEDISTPPKGDVNQATSVFEKPIQEGTVEGYDYFEQPRIYNNKKQKEKQSVFEANSHEENDEAAPQGMDDKSIIVGTFGYGGADFTQRATGKTVFEGIDDRKSVNASSQANKNVQNTPAANKVKNSQSRLLETGSM